MRNQLPPVRQTLAPLLVPAVLALGKQNAAPDRRPGPSPARSDGVRILAARKIRSNFRGGQFRIIWLRRREPLRRAFNSGVIEMKKDRRGINPASKPSGDGCVECLASPRGWWFHLRRCAECGHIGCCDSSPSQHASKHAATTAHPIIASFEPGEDWFYDYETQETIEGVELLPPHSHPRSQAVPGPAGRVPANWESLLN